MALVEQHHIDRADKIMGGLRIRIFLNKDGASWCFKARVIGPRRRQAPEHRVKCAQKVGCVEGRFESKAMNDDHDLSRSETCELQSDEIESSPAKLETVSNKRSLSTEEVMIGRAVML